MGSRIIKYITNSVLELIYCGDEKCIICGTPTAEEKLLCDDCRKKIRIYNYATIIKKDDLELQCYSSVYYTGIIVELIKKLKYSSSFESGKVLAGLLIDLIKNKGIDFDLITFVPMHKKALKKRGFNQSKYLAKLIGDQLDKPVLNCLKKPFATKDQIGLDGIDRWENQVDSFKALNKKHIKNKKILLVDDVLTTGATTFYASKELLKSGALKVCILTVAKSKL